MTPDARALVDALAFTGHTFVQNVKAGGVEAERALRAALAGGSE